MSQKCAKKLVLLKTFYYKSQFQDGQTTTNRTFYITNPSTTSFSNIRYLTDKNYYPIENEFIQFNAIRIPPNNPNSGINKQISQDNFMIKTKCGFVSANTFYFDDTSSNLTTVLINNYDVTAASGDLKNAVKIIMEYDNDGTIFSNGVKFARRLRVYGYACK